MSTNEGQTQNLDKNIALENTDESVALGFWIYLMTDAVLFAALFAVYAVLNRNTFGGPTNRQIVNLPFVLTETVLLLTSSYTMGLTLLAAYRRDQRRSLQLLFTTACLGIAFLIMEFGEFRHLIIEGNGFQRSAFLSSYFTLVGTHGLHITVGLLWAAVLAWRLWKQGLSSPNYRKLTMLALFWHFLDIIWIFIFTIVYLIGIS